MVVGFIETENWNGGRQGLGMGVGSWCFRRQSFSLGRWKVLEMGMYFTTSFLLWGPFVHPSGPIEWDR